MPLPTSPRRGWDDCSGDALDEDMILWIGSLMVWSLEDPGAKEVKGPTGLYRRNEAGDDYAVETCGELKLGRH
jgi:hypothetical protein